MPQYKLKEGKLVRRNEKGEKETLVAGDKVEMTKDQARTFGLNLLELQHADEQEDVEQEDDGDSKQKQSEKLTVNPADEKQAAQKQPAQKHPANKKA